MASAASKPAPPARDDAPLLCASAGPHFLAALVMVTRLMANGWLFGTGRVQAPWGDFFVLFGGTVAAAAAARGIAFAPSLAAALRKAAASHGAAAILTVAASAAVLANLPVQRPLIGAEDTPSLARTVYTRAVEPFFLRQLALGLLAALAFRALTRPTRRAREAREKRGVRRKLVHRACNPGPAIGCHLARPRRGIRRLGRPRDTHLPVHRVRLTFPTPASNCWCSSSRSCGSTLAAAASAGAVARARAGCAIGLGFGAQLVAAAASVLAIGAARILYQYGHNPDGGVHALIARGGANRVMTGIPKPLPRRG